MSNDDIISAPAPSSGITWGDLDGKLLIIEPLAYETGLTTQFSKAPGDTNAVRANVTALTGPDTADTYDDTLVFPKVLAGQLKNNIGSKVVGRLKHGEGKPGQDAPWMLAEATPDDLAKAKAYLEKATQPAVTSAEAPF